MNISTEDYINLLKNDSQDELIKLYETSSWGGSIDFQVVYDSIKNIENNSSVYYALGVWIYMFSYHGGEIQEAKGIYYLRKSIKLGNQYACDSLKELLQIKPDYQDDNARHVDLLDSVVHLVDDYIMLEERYDELVEENKRLQLEIDYRPDGVGYTAAKEDFESHKEKSF